MGKCDKRTEVYSRVTGYYSPLHRWNRGKKSEYKDRREFVLTPKTTISMGSE